MSSTHDLIIVGAGSAGLSAAQYGARANLKTLVLEEMAPGGQALLISDLENYPGFPEPINGFDFSENMKKQALNFGAEILSTTVKKLDYADKIYTIQTGKGEFKAPAVIIATGAKHKHMEIPGEEEFSGKGVSYCATCDGPFFKGKKILVVGGGDAACDESIYLSKLTDKLVHIHRRDRFRAQQVLANRVLDHDGIEVRLSTVATEIKGDTKVTSVIFQKTDTGEVYEEEFDAVFIFIGSIPQTSLVDHLAKDEAGYIITDQTMATSQAGLFAVGDVRATPFRQIVTACSDGATAAHIAAQYIDELEGHAYK